MKDNPKPPKSTAWKPPSADDLKLREIILSIADEDKPEAIRILRRIVEETRANEE